jgi:uncharacterized protein YndB with AHSA1/START domain
MSPTQNAAHSIADLSEGVILASVDIAVPPQRVFAALTDGAEITRWWGDDAVYRTTSWKSDFRVGGQWRADGIGADGHPFYVGGEFLEIDAPRKLVQTWEPQWDPGATTTITYVLAATETGTRLTLRHEGFKGRPQSCQGHSDGWQTVLGWLVRYVAPAPQPDTASYFFCRLLPPRPDFAYTLSPEERAVMQAHSNYWRGKLATSEVVVFGPVADPVAPYGMGIVRAQTEADLKAFQDNDPAISSGIGLRYESTKMLAAVWNH